MSKNFRLFDDIDISHWTNRENAYSSAHINTIVNPNAGITNIQPTSIPTPFARMELMNTAFKVVTDSKQLDGKTIYHKIISQVLDLAELLFNADQFPELNVEQWSFSDDLTNLKNSTNPKHKLLADTLTLYLNQGGDTLGINEKTIVSIFSYRGKILGATSPSTLFYTAGNTLNFGGGLKVGPQVFFSPQPTPLYKRDFEFQKFLYLTVFSSGRSNDTVMKSLVDYLIKSKEVLGYEKSSIIDEIIHSSPDSNSILLGSEYIPLKIGDKDILSDGIVLFKSKGPKIESDFEINSSLLSPNDLKPLVLQNAYTLPAKYVNEATPWTVNITVPYVDSVPLSERRLPQQQIKYPYLTVSDFLEPFIIELPYNLSTQYYGSQFNKNKSFCLPLSKTFFQYFTIEELQTRKVGGESMYKLSHVHAGVKVELRIPIKGNRYVTLSRVYTDSHGQIEPDLNKNEGNIKEINLGIGIFPFFKTPEGVAPKYRVSRIVQHYTDLPVRFKNNNDYIVEKNSYLRSQGTNAPFFNSKYFELEQNFNLIEIGLEDSSNVLLPLFKDINQGAINYIYGIDFGTSNTHVEYRNSINSQQSQALSVKLDDQQVGYTFDVKNKEVDIVDIAEFEFISQIIDADNDTGFPIKSVVSSKENETLGATCFSLGQVSIPFNYSKLDKEFFPNKLTHNLKWNNFSKNPNENTKVRLFLDELVFLIRNNVLLKGGNLQNTVINWSFPTSMSLFEKMKLGSLYDEVIEKYFGHIKSVSVTESIAPFYYLKENGGLIAHTNPVASVDIGGGTTDIVIYQNGEAQKLSSFKFGANILYQNGVNGNPSENGFKTLIQDFKEQNRSSEKYTKLEAHLKLYADSSEEQEIVNYLFRIENSNEFKDSLIVSFSDLIKNNPDTKIVYLYYFSSIIYHLAQYSDKMGYEPMSTISLTGQGAKVLRFIDSSSRLKLLSKLVTKIFKHVYQRDVSEINIQLLPNPKEITAKGLLFTSANIEADNLIDVLISSKNQILKSSNNISYRQLDRGILENIEKDVLDFNQMFFALHKDIDFNNTFGINMTWEGKYKKAVGTDVLGYIIEVTDRYKMDQNSVDAKVNDTPFFYSIKQALYELAKVSINKNNNNEY